MTWRKNIIRQMPSDAIHVRFDESCHAPTICRETGIQLIFTPSLMFGAFPFFFLRAVVFSHCVAFKTTHNILSVVHSSYANELSRVMTQLQTSNCF